MTPEVIRNLSISELIELGEFDCACGKKHAPGLKRVLLRKGAVLELPECIRELQGHRVFLLSGHDTFAAAGGTVLSVLEKAAIPCSKYVFPHSPVKPTEATVGSALMHFDYSCDIIVGVGSGVINDTAKLIARATSLPYIIVATAPSVDGYLSATSSMDMDGLKVSLPCKVPDIVIGDPDILCNAPMKLLVSGVGDVAAKIVSLREWEMANLLIGEYFCPVVYAMMDGALKRVLASAEGLKNREPEAVLAVMEGLLIAGMAMNYAGVTRPASGMEHYFSHLWDMRALAFPGLQTETHGNQAGLGTLYTLKLWDYIIKNVTPDKEKALRFVASFDNDQWNGELLRFVGPGANAMIANEEREHKYSPESHARRLPVILENWDRLLELMSAKPDYREFYDLLRSINAPLSAHEFGYTDEELQKTLMMTKDIRDKYVTTRLLWDLGELQEAAEAFRG